MANAVLITGIAGSGKSAVCAEIKRRGRKAFDIENIEGLFRAIDQRTGEPLRTSWDDLASVEHLDWVCDKEKLEDLIQANARETTFYCGTASNIDDIFPLFEKVFLLRADPDTIRTRLANRKLGDFGYDPEVREWVFTWKDRWENNMQKSGAVAVDANRDLVQIVDEILRVGP